MAWERLGAHPPGHGRVQAICELVHGHLEFGSGAGDATTTALGAHRAGRGVCRDFAHLAIALCRALNVPARYVFGDLPDVGVRPPDARTSARGSRPGSGTAGTRPTPATTSAAAAGP